MTPTTFNNRMAQLLQLPGWIAGLSFGIGTLILLLHLSIKDEMIIGIGMLYLVFAFFLNASVFGSLIICSFLFKEYQKQILLQAAILLINIPVAILYLYVVINNPFTTSSLYQF